MEQIRRWILLLAGVVMALTSLSTSAFVQPTLSTTRRSIHRNAFIDPFHDALHHHPTIEALLSTLYTEVLKPAHGHTQPLFGPPDPILSAGKSIIPNPNAFTDAGLTASDVSGIPEKVSEALSKSKSVNVVDPRALMQFDKVLPGFTPPGHILPEHSLPEETPESLILEMGNVAKMMRVVINLPLVAFLYSFVEFFLVQPGYDVYKEELDEDRPGAAIEFLVLSGVRLAIFSAIGIFTLALFDH